MTASRLPLIFGQPLLLKLRSPNMAPSVAASRRHFSTSRNHIRCRSSSGHDERLLDPFIGRWREVSCEGLHEFLQATGVPKDQQTFLRSAKVDLIYSRIKNQWKIDQGFQDFPHRTAYTFKLNEVFPVQMSVGPLMNCIVTQDGALWLEKWESVTKPVLTMTVKNEVHGGKLISVAKVQDAVVKRTFARE